MIEHLIATMNADLEIDRIREDVGAFAEQFLAVEKDFEAKSTVVYKAKMDLEILVVQVGEIEAKIQEDESRLKKSRARLNEIKTNFEFQAMKREVDAMERGNQEAERVLTEKRAELAKLQESMQAMAQDFEKTEQTYQGFKRDLDQKMSEIASLVESKEKERRAHEDKVDRALLKHYHLIRERKFKDALVEVDHGACQGCYMSLPPQMANEILRSSAETVFQCPHCQRLLFKKAAS